MTPTANGTAPHAGINAPSGVSRVLILGYSDGATDGVLQFGDGGPVYRFDLEREAHNPGGCDERTFELRPLPADALDRIAAGLEPYQPSRWPVWAPLWTFPTAEARQAVERLVDDVLAEAGPVTWAITTTDTVAFARFMAVPAGAASASSRRST